MESVSIPCQDRQKFGRIEIVPPGKPMIQSLAGDTFSSTFFKKRKESGGINESGYCLAFNRTLEASLCSLMVALQKPDKWTKELLATCSRKNQKWFMAWP
jgi:hypothetical protein